MHAASWDTGATVTLLEFSEGDGTPVAVYADRESALEAMLTEIACFLNEDGLADSEDEARAEAERLAAEHGGLGDDGDFFVDLYGVEGFDCSWTTTTYSLLAQPGTEGVAL